MNKEFKMSENMTIYYILWRKSNIKVEFGLIPYKGGLLLPGVPTSKRLHVAQHVSLTRTL